MTNTASAARVGAVFDGRYQLERQLGQEDGGHRVYLATEVAGSREVVLKILDRAEVPNEVAAKRFLREMEATRRVQHPNIVHVHDCGETDGGTLYIAMEVLKGRTLQRQIKQHGPLEPERAASIGAQIAEALQSAHDQGVLHRDLKPTNIRLVSAHGTRDWVKVLDFGIARFLEDDDINAEQLTAAGKVIGTPQYMSPEQVASKPLDGRSDLYALGVLLYYMVAGQPAFQGKTFEILRQHIFERPKPPSASASQDVPEALEQIIMKLLEKDPNDRYQEGLEVSRALRLAVDSIEPQTPMGISFADEMDDPERTESIPGSDPEDDVPVSDPEPPAAGGFLKAAFAMLGFTAVFAIGLTAVVVAFVVVWLLL